MLAPATRPWASVAVVAVVALAGAALLAAHGGRGVTPTALLVCTPCVSGPGCVAGCLRAEAQAARLQQLAPAAEAHRAARADSSAAARTSLHDQERAIQRRNQALLQVGHDGGSAALGGVLDSAVKQVLRAEAAEVKLRRQAAISKGASVGSVYANLRCVGALPALRCSAADTPLCLCPHLRGWQQHPPVH